MCYMTLCLIFYLKSHSFLVFGPITPGVAQDNFVWLFYPPQAPLQVHFCLGSLSVLEHLVITSTLPIFNMVGVPVQVTIMNETLKNEALIKGCVDVIHLIIRHPNYRTITYLLKKISISINWPIYMAKKFGKPHPSTMA